MLDRLRDIWRLAAGLRALWAWRGAATPDAVGGAQPGPSPGHVQQQAVPGVYALLAGYDRR